MIEDAIGRLDGLDLSDEEREEIIRNYKEGVGIQHVYGVPTHDFFQNAGNMFQAEFGGKTFDAVIRVIKGFHVVFPARSACLAIALTELIGETLEEMCESAVSEEHFRANVAPWFVLRYIYSASHTVPGTMLCFEEETVAQILRTLYGTCIVCFSSSDNAMLQILRGPSENCSRVFFIEYVPSHFFAPQKSTVNGRTEMTRVKRGRIIGYIGVYGGSLGFSRTYIAQIKRAAVKAVHVADQFTHSRFNEDEDGYEDESESESEGEESAGEESEEGEGEDEFFDCLSENEGEFFDCD